jgi:hypothetical protein
MKRALTVTESEDNSAILFSIFSIADNEYPCGKEGRMRFVDPECPEFSSFLIRIGLYETWKQTPSLLDVERAADVLRALAKQGRQSEVDHQASLWDLQLVPRAFLLR